MDIAIRTLTNPDEWADIPKLEQAIWGNDDPVPTSWMRVMVSLGGEVSVAFDPHQPGEFLGFTMSIGSCDAGGPFLYSHQAGVVPDHQGQGIGRILKYHQNAWAETAGYARIQWTFDPLRANNAYFNVAVLGADIVAYYPNYYGTMTSRLNRGLPSDRVLCEWRVPRPPRSASGALNHSCAIRIPPDIGVLKVEDPDLGLRWRENVERQFQDALWAGLRVVGFAKHPYPAYLLAEPEA